MFKKNLMRNIIIILSQDNRFTGYKTQHPVVIQKSDSWIPPIWLVIPRN